MTKCSLIFILANCIIKSAYSETLDAAHFSSEQKNLITKTTPFYSALISHDFEKVNMFLNAKVRPTVQYIYHPFWSNISANSHWTICAIKKLNATSEHEMYLFTSFFKITDKSIVNNSISYRTDIWYVSKNKSSLSVLPDEFFWLFTDFEPNENTVFNFLTLSEISIRHSERIKKNNEVLSKMSDIFNKKK